MIIKNIEDIGKAYTFWRNNHIRIDNMNSPRELGYLKYYELYPNRFLGAFIEDSLVGTIIYFIDGRKGSIYRLAVENKNRNKGIATKLIAAAEDKIRAEGIDSVFCLIEDQNIPSKRVFYKNGYKTFENIKYYIKQL